MRFSIILMQFALLPLLCYTPALQAQEKPWQHLGRKASADEIKAWDIDVRGDFKGLPQGQGSVAQGERIWEAKCASCHGSFGELNEVFPPLIGGTTAQDIKLGRVAANANNSVAQRTMMMKLARLSTLWDYVNRAMPWNAPKTLQTDEVYAVVAYILNLGSVVPEDFVLSHENIAQVQAKLPNRNGLVRFDGMWQTKGKPDMQNQACMKNCDTEAISSSLPEFARNAHGNLSEQNRLIGGLRGADTTRPAAQALMASTTANLPGTTSSNSKPNAVKAIPTVAGMDMKALLAKNTCTACHGLKNKIVGPSMQDIGARYQNKADAEAYLINKIKSGGAGVWGSVPMPPQSQLKEAELKAIAQWLLKEAQ